jgi:hypothetical protein
MKCSELIARLDIIDITFDIEKMDHRLSGMMGQCHGGNMEVSIEKMVMQSCMKKVTNSIIPEENNYLGTIGYHDGYESMLTYQIFYDGYYIVYTRHGIIHRKIFPALIVQDGYIAWGEYGLNHRKTHPAIIRESGKREYWIRGKRQLIVNGFR